LLCYHNKDGMDSVGDKEGLPSKNNGVM